MLEWRPVPGFSDYEVSERGDVRRIKGAKSSAAGRVLRGHTTRAGYRTVSLHFGKCVGKSRFVHRLVCEAFYGRAPTYKHEVAHLDGNKLNNSKSNLRWVFRAENEAHKRMHGTDNRGERHPRHKLTAEAVRQIRAEYAGRPGQGDDLGERFGVTKYCIRLVARGERWGHLDDYRRRRAAALKARRR